VKHAGALGILGLTTLAVGCEPSAPVARPPATTTEDLRAPAFASTGSRAAYARGVAGLGALDALRGTAMTPSFATDLGFKCAALRAVQTSLAAEQDPLVLRLTTRIDKTCNFDVPLSCAPFEIDRIENKRASDPGAAAKAECAGLRLAIGDFGSRYVENPKVVDVISKDVDLCGARDDSVVRRRD